MTQGKRIILNVIATWGRSLYGLAIGLFTTRWVLSSLGVVDFGLYGVVGGLAVFIEFINGLLKSSTCRFYAYSVGRAKKACEFKQGALGVEECRKWFSIAVVVHTIVPCALLGIGYPVGIYTIENLLTIPADRVDACIWVFRFVCASCFVGMVNVPFSAMYTAKQYIAELTIYSFIEKTVMFAFIWYMSCRPADWLVPYALAMSIVSILPYVVITTRAIVVFPECRLRMRAMLDKESVKQFCQFAFWQALGNLGFVIKTQGMQLLLNKCFSPVANATMSIANRVASQSQTLTISLQGALAPAITTACGAGDLVLMRRLAYRACKFGLLLSLLFMLPLALELPYVMKLWLINVPVDAVTMCLLILAVMLIDKSSIGHTLSVAANGKIAMYQTLIGTVSILSLPVAYLLVKIGVGVNSVGCALVLTASIATIGRVVIARRLVGLSPVYWLTQVIGPILCVAMLAGFVGGVSVIFIKSSFSRLCITTAVCECVMLPLAWRYLLDCEERKYVAGALERVVGQWRRQKHGR